MRTGDGLGTSWLVSKKNHRRADPKAKVGEDAELQGRVIIVRVFVALFPKPVRQRASVFSIPHHPNSNPSIKRTSSNTHNIETKMTREQQQQDRQANQAKSLSFCKEIIRHDPPSYESGDNSSDRSSPCLDELWYTRMELSFIKKEVGRVLMDHVGLGPPKSTVTLIPELWGLERHNLQRAQEKKAAIQLILMAQHLRNIKGDPELLRSLSLQVSKGARNFAREQGLRDARHHDTDAAELVVDGCISDVDLSACCDSLEQCCSKRKRPLPRMIVQEEEHLYERRVRSRATQA